MPPVRGALREVVPVGAERALYAFVEHVDRPACSVCTASRSTSSGLRDAEARRGYRRDRGRRGRRLPCAVSRWRSALTAWTVPATSAA